MEPHVDHLPSTAGDQFESSQVYEEFVRLFARDRDRIYSYIYSLLPHHADAEDCFQRCSVILWQRFGEFQRDRLFITWAYGVAFNVVRNFSKAHRRDKLRLDSDVVELLAEDRMSGAEKTMVRIEALRQCLSLLKVPEKELLEIAYSSEGSLKEFAILCGQALQSIYNRLSKLRRHLHHCVEYRLSEENRYAP
jgi:RNA polymerase sigma-70 factor (ECF subfamily)